MTLSTENTETLYGEVLRAIERGIIKSVKIEREVIEILTLTPDHERVYMNGLRTITVVVDPYTKEHWEEIDRCRI